MQKTRKQSIGFVALVTLWLEGALSLSQAFERLLVDVVAAFVPWLAPVIPAYLAFHSLYYVLMPGVLWVSIVGAVVVEFLGLATVTTVVQFNDFNSTQIGAGEKAPFWSAVLTAAFYLTVVLTVNVLLDTADPTKKFAKFLLSSLSVAGAITISLRGQHRRRVEAKAARDARLDEERKKKEEDETAYKRRVAEERRKDKLELKRLELKAKVAENKTEEEKVAVKVSESSAGKPETFGKWKTWRQVPESEKSKIVDLMKVKSKRMAMEEVVKNYGVSERVAYGWLEYTERDKPIQN